MTKDQRDRLRADIKSAMDEQTEAVIDEFIKMYEKCTTDNEDVSGLTLRSSARVSPKAAHMQIDATAAFTNSTKSKKRYGTSYDAADTPLLDAMGKGKGKGKDDKAEDAAA